MAEFQTLFTLIENASHAAYKRLGYGRSAPVRAKLGVAQSYLRLASRNKTEAARRRNLIEARNAFRCAIQLTHAA